jgi:hypothetical protein
MKMLAKKESAMDLYDDTIRLDVDSSILVKPNAPYAVQRAVEGLARDLLAILGAAPRIARDMAAASATAIIIETTADGDGCFPLEDPPVGKEMFVIRVARNPDRAARIKNMVVIRGADIRGTIFGIYTFAEKFLGVDPLRFWTGLDPERKDSIVLHSEYYRSRPPTFE